MARQLLYSFSKWLPKFRNVPSASLTSTSVSDELEKLENLVKTIQPVLRDAEDKENRESSVKLWLKELRDVAYDAEDVLLEFQYHILQAQVLEMRNVAAASETTGKKKRVDGGEEVNPFASGSNLAVGEVSIQHDMAKRIEKIRKEFASGSNFSVGEFSMPQNMVDKIKKMRERFEEIKSDKVFLELKATDGEMLLDSVTEYPRETTSMATDIYGREDDKKKLIDLLLSESKYEVIAVVGKGGLGKTTLAQLVYHDPRVSNYFREMRIWIWVPDDICNLQRLTKLLIERITNSSCNLSDLSDLRESLQNSLQGKRLFLVLDDVWINEKDLWEPLSNLLQSAEMTKIIVTTRNADVAETMKATVLYPLGYLPWEYCWQLFVPRAFGGRNLEDFPWLVEIGKKIVRKCDGLPLAVKSLGALLRQYETDEDAWQDVLESDLWELDDEKDVLPALRLSYSRMPNKLKPCFEICSMFPKYHVYDKDELVKLWVAHGYVQHEAGKDVEEVGYKYFNELHRRSFFDEYEEEVSLDYDEEGGKVKVKRYRMHDNIRDLAHYVLDETDMKHMIRHLFITDDEERILPINETGVPRTLIVREVDVSTMNDILLKLASLRHLRYLDIDDYDEGFFFSRSDEEFLLPEGIGNLICLRHLKINIGMKMRALELVGHLYNLVVLEIRCEGLVEFPESLRSLVSLTSIYFRDFQNDQLPALGELPSLKSLILKGFFSVTSIGNEFCRAVSNRNEGVAFPSLISLVFEHMPNLEKWDGLRDGDIPQLQKLEINHCRKFSSLPALKNLTTLKSSHDGKLCLPSGSGELTKLKILSGKFGMKKDVQFGFLNNLVNLKYLTLENVRSALFTHACLKGNHGIEKLILKLSSFYDCDDDDLEPFEIQEDEKEFTLRLVVEGGGHDRSLWEYEDELDDLEAAGFSLPGNLQEMETEDYDAHDNSTLDDEKNASFSLLQNFQPHANLQQLEIEDYNGGRWPGWIGDPSFNKLTHVMLTRCRSVDQLPTLGQLLALRYLSLRSIYRLKRLGNEFCRGINDGRDVVAFPSLIELSFSGIRKWEEWDGVLDGDFPLLKKLSIVCCQKLSSIPNLGNFSRLSHLELYECRLVKLSSEGPFPPNLKILHYDGCGSTMWLSLNGKLAKLRRLRGKFFVGRDEVFEILKNLDKNHNDLAITMLENVGNAVKGKGVPELELELKRMELAWSTSDSANSRVHGDLCLVIDDGNSISDDKERNEIRPSNLLEKLWPRTNLEYLKIQGYDDFAYPTWIGHPSFDKLTKVVLNSCKIDILPTLGELPCLEYLFLCSISRLKIIAHEFCRSTFSLKVAFPSLTHLEFEKMDDWEEWYDYGVLVSDFPRLRTLNIRDCTKLSSLGALRNIRVIWDLRIYECPALQLSLRDKVLNRSKLNCENLRVRKDDLFQVLNTLNGRDLALKGLGNVCTVFKVEDPPRVELLSLSWRASAYTSCGAMICRKLVICDNNYFIANDAGRNEIEPSILLEYLRPDTKLKYLHIEGYDSIGYPSWIGHPSFDKLTSVDLGDCKNEQLPSLGQLPALGILGLRFISRLKRIGHEFCRSTMSSHHEFKAAFPSLTTMYLENFNDLEEWNDVLDGDFPRLQELRVLACPKLSSLWAQRNPSFHSRLKIYSCPQLQLSSE